MKLLDNDIVKQNIVESRKLEKPDELLTNRGLNFGLFKGNVPIVPERGFDWIKTSDNELSKSFHFTDTINMMRFINELVEEMENLFHHSRFEVFQYEVKVLLQTTNIFDVTQQDLELSRFLDETYFDIEEQGLHDFDE